ncbi:nSTAND3 domain-containing NTPase [Vagococcus carniphilus]|uniref:Novel STAND NTPase 3 domain-containing protein n=1 Tax=Vagococcus carniphilus TaxID=218144 RepID=A0A430ARY6_9ENTE|nr:ATP-binding protein [Vagococcus carniphilus]MDT2813281.1 ATP-binding protein [Vagococcus carniphilus]QNN73253.1 ATP-binding protein [Vagococcus carniphilus]RSU10810.1 hypothetical protein CBF28_12990 [Vagococcus carniphilus]
MFDYTMLNDYEFELLCRDIFQKFKGNKREYFTFSAGRDGGIDICDKEKKEIIQVKHYSKSSTSSLMTSLNKELEKIKKIETIEKYYVMTSNSLTLRNKQDIVKIFKKYMLDTSHVWGKEDIDKFLADENNTDIVRKNFKLWLNATNVLELMLENDILVDSEELLDSIEKKKELYVDTKAFHDSLKIFEKYNALILLGAPGVGKSTISEMLLLYYVNKGYSIRYVSSNDIGKIKQSLYEKSTSEVILLDDFLGQHYLKLDDKQPNELKTLLSKIIRSKNKKIILNSRITIFNEAFYKSQIFQNTFENYDLKKYTIDLNQITVLEKAKILYNHLYFNNIGKKYCKTIYYNKQYKEIINHKNYNPRIMEFVTNSRNLEFVEPNEYFSFIIGRLDNPEDVWKDEFENRLDKIDRIFMNTLYSLSDTKVNKEVLKIAFNNRIKKLDNIDTTINNFETVLVRLTKSLLIQSYSKKRKKIFISVLNPSINDYIQKSISLNPIELANIVNYSNYYEQISNINRLDTENDLIRKFLYNKGFNKLKSMEGSIYYYYLEELINNQILDESLIENVHLSLCSIKDVSDIPSIEKFSEVLTKLLTESFFEFYQLDSILLEENFFENYITIIDFKTACILIKKTPYSHKLKNVFFEELPLTLEWELASDYESIIDESWGNLYGNLFFEEPQYLLVEDNIDAIKDVMLTEASDILAETVDKYFVFINDSFFENDEEKEQIKEEVVDELLNEISNEVYERIRYEINEVNEPEYEYEYEERYTDNVDNNEGVIDDMFNRLTY